MRLKKKKKKVEAEQLKKAILVQGYAEQDQLSISSLQQQRNPVLNLVPAYHYTEIIIPRNKIVLLDMHPGILKPIIQLTQSYP